MCSLVISLSNMEVSDSLLCRNRDWDPSYLSQLLSDDFYEFSDLWSDSNATDTELIQEVEKYCPIVEDISMDDETLCNEVEKIEIESNCV